ncbi:MAG TPA: chemotaxis-specific protein-glutamate methyltransferase CheB [Clostridia bacterium]|nr:chemotaxis-specific protein-glutamate methyltransferase CheB [Clostridia bacterium]
MDKLKVLVVDDSLVYRKIISRAVERTDKAVVDCTASSGITALERLEQRPIDVVLMDVFMPGMDGLETLTRIKDKYGDLPVVIISSGGVDGAKLTVRALEYGAMDFIQKPSQGHGNKNIDAISRHLNILFSQILIDRYAINNRENQVSKDAIPKAGRRLDASRAREGESLTRGSGIIPGDGKRPPRADRASGYGTPCLSGIDLVVIASSTGGPNAVEEVCQGIGPGFTKPVLIVQHMPPDFTKIFSRFLGRKCEMPVKEAEEGDKIVGGQVLVAPGGYHMSVNARGPQITLTTSPPVNGVRPAADVLFESVAEAYAGKRVLAVILTGMGSDGTRGVKALKEACQCYCITQSRETCVIYGMPRSVFEAGLSDEVVDLKDIGRRIIEINRGRC